MECRIALRDETDDDTGQPAAQTTQADDKTAAEKAPADTDEAMDKRIKSICRGR